MNIALYYPWVYLHGGPERTAVELLARSRHNWTIFTNRYEPDATFPALKHARIVEMAPVSVKRTFFAAGKAAVRIAAQRLPLRDHHALLVFCEGLGDLSIARRLSIPAACLCFTPLRAAFDAHYQEHYLEMKGGRVLREPVLRAAAAAFRVVDRRLWKRYQRVFAISREVKRRIVEGKLFPESRIELLYPGVDLRRLAPTGEYSSDFLIPGRIMWTKNLELAIDAFQLLLKRRPDLSRFTLTVAGFVDRKSESYLARLRERAAECRQIRFLVSPDDRTLFSVCSSAYAMLYPPFNEDWGLAPLEAMALEKPVVAVNRGGPAESVVDGETGFLVDPTPERFANAMERLVDDPDLVRRMGRKARTRAAEFDWARFCERLDDSMDELAHARARGMVA